MRLGFVWPSSMALALGEGKEEVRIFGWFRPGRWPWATWM